jgi:16S rRNA (guanine527-N7)-methyltransferase
MRFHVEHDMLRTWASDRGISMDMDTMDTLVKYAHMLYETNIKFNLTGLARIDDIIHNLIIGSIDPVIRLNVPRGTLFADIGSGAGIPGIPLGIVHHDMRGILIESNNKKSDFISSVIRELRLNNLSVYHGRIEAYHAFENREQIDIVFSRALGDPYYVIELGAPILKHNGLLYIYSRLNHDELPAYVRQHIIDLGLSIVTDDIKREGMDDSGLLFIKTGNTESRYPRKISIIKRDIMRLSRSSTA